MLRRVVCNWKWRSLISNTLIIGISLYDLGHYSYILLNGVRHIHSWVSKLDFGLYELDMKLELCHNQYKYFIDEKIITFKSLKKLKLWRCLGFNGNIFVEVYNNSTAFCLVVSIRSEMYDVHALLLFLYMPCTFVHFCRHYPSIPVIMIIPPNYYLLRYLIWYSGFTNPNQWVQCCCWREAVDNV